MSSPAIQEPHRHQGVFLFHTLRFQPRLQHPQLSEDLQFSNNQTPSAQRLQTAPICRKKCCHAAFKKTAIKKQSNYMFCHRCSRSTILHYYHYLNRTQGNKIPKNCYDTFPSLSEELQCLGHVTVFRTDTCLRERNYSGMQPTEFLYILPLYSDIYHNHWYGTRSINQTCLTI